MLLVSEICFETISAQHLITIANNVQRALPDVLVTPLNKQLRPTEWQHDDVIALRIKQDDKKKHFMQIGLKGALISPEKVSPETLDSTLDILSQEVSIQPSESDTLITGIMCTLCFLGLFVAILVLKAIPESAVLTCIMIGSGATLLTGVGLFAVRSIKAPQQGRSTLALLLTLPGFIMLAPMSILNMPIINHFRRLQGSRLLPEHSIETFELVNTSPFRAEK